MFIKTTKSKGQKYIQIVKGYRENGKVKQQVIANLGREDILIESGLEKIAQSLLEISGKDSKLKDISTMEELSRVNYGYLAYKKLWNNFGLTQLLSSLPSKVEFDIPETIFSLVINRLLKPSSKLFHFNSKDTYFGMNEGLKLEYLYKSLDILSKNKEEIENKLFEKNVNLFNLKIDVIFYDLTTYYFESQRPDDLKDFGFSKDKKVNEVQVMMGLLVDKDGRPIGYDLFNGSTSETKTLITVIKKLKSRFNIDTVVLVADRGINTKLNLKELRDNGFDYILSSRIKNMPKKIQEKILNEEGYKQLSAGEFLEEKEDIFKYKVLNYENPVRYEESGQTKEIILNELLVCTYSSKRARKDEKDRNRQLEKAEEIIETKNKSAISNKKGFKKYLKIQENIDILDIDYEKIEHDKLFDGYYAIQTSKKDLNPIDILKNYHFLYKIEESFRILKSTMETRPIFHWTEKRIEGHFMLCFIAFLLERDLEYRLANNKKLEDISYSPEKIKQALNSMELSIVDIEKEKFYLKSKQDPLASRIFDMLKINLPKSLNSKEDIKRIQI